MFFPTQQQQKSYHNIKDAQQAQSNLDQMKKDKDFDAEFFAQNYEFFYDAFNDSRTEITNTNVFENNDHPLIQKFDNPSNDSGVGVGSYYQRWN